MNNKEDMFIVIFEIENRTPDIKIYENYESLITNIQFQLKYEIIIQKFYNLKKKQDKREYNELILTIKYGNIKILNECINILYSKFDFRFNFKIYKYNELINKSNLVENEFDN